MDRRQFFRIAGAAGALAVLPQVVVQAAADAAVRIAGIAYAPKFTQALRRPTRITPATNSTTTIEVSQFNQQVLTGYPATPCYGYGVAGTTPSWPGPTIVARSNAPLKFTWANKLPTGTRKLADGGHLLPVDGTLIPAEIAALPAGQKPMVTHLHGSHAEWQSDGYPDAWFTQNGTRGSMWQKATYTYDNSQVGATLWYHDHTMGLTRLNVGAGMSGAYLVRDATDTNLTSSDMLPRAAYEQELILQDRWFMDDGTIFMDTAAPPTSGIGLQALGDFIIVNGTPWPVMDVEPRKYRLRVVNGADSRVFVLQQNNNRPFLVIGTELGMLPTAVSATRLPMAPGERYDIVIDFTGLPNGNQVVLRNDSVDGPFRGFRQANGTVTNRPLDVAYGFGPASDTRSTAVVMMFRVSQALKTAVPNARVVAGSALGPALPVRTSTRTRGVITFFGTDGLGRGMEMLGSLSGGSAMWMDPVTEVVANGTTETWEIYNTGPVAHPIHLHLVDFQVLDRAPFGYTSTAKPMMDGGTGAVLTITGTGTRRPPETYERGRKDTVICYPGEVTRVIATFDRAGNYVWHCHILHHEDHDMMRPIRVS